VNFFVRLPASTRRGMKLFAIDLHIEVWKGLFITASDSRHGSLCSDHITFSTFWQLLIHHFASYTSRADVSGSWVQKSLEPAVRQSVVSTTMICWIAASHRLAVSGDVEW
jgi:hypothetical protein